jgi:hypothetical protein
MKENQVSRSESWDGKLSLSGNFWNGKHFKTHLVIRPQNLDDRCDNRRFLLSAQDFLASTPTHKNLKVEYKLLCCVCLKHRLKIQTEKLDTNWKIRQDQKIRLRVLSRRLKIKEARERGRVVVRYAYSYDSVKRVFFDSAHPKPRHLWYTFTCASHETQGNGQDPAHSVVKRAQAQGPTFWIQPARAQAKYVPWGKKSCTPLPVNSCLPIKEKELLPIL